MVEFITVLIIEQDQDLTIQLVTQLTMEEYITVTMVDQDQDLLMVYLIVDLLEEFTTVNTPGLIFHV